MSVTYRNLETQTVSAALIKRPSTIAHVYTHIKHMSDKCSELYYSYHASTILQQM